MTALEVKAFQCYLNERSFFFICVRNMNMSSPLEIILNYLKLQFIFKYFLYINNKLFPHSNIYTGKYSWTQANFWILKQDFMSLSCGNCNSEFPENQIIKINTKIYSVFFTYFKYFSFCFLKDNITFSPT